MNMSFRTRLGLVPLVCMIGVACGSTEAPPAGPADPEPTTPPAPTTPAPAPTTPGEQNDPDEDPPNTGPEPRAKCGAAPYTWVESTKLGDVLENHKKGSWNKYLLAAALQRSEVKSAVKTKRLPKHDTNSRLLRYQTQDRGKLIDATMLLAYPSDKQKTYPVMLILHGTAGFHDGCAPTRGVADDQLGGLFDEAGLLVSLFASFGYIAVAPDYIGLKSLGDPTGFLHPYLVAEPTAIASLDAIRAAKKALAGEKATPGDIVVMGGSQGGHGAAFVNRYQPHYAPELPIKGSVWDVPPTDLLGQAKPALTNWQNSTKNLVAASTTLESWYGASPNGYASVFLPPYDTAVPEALATNCKPKAALDGGSLETMFTPEFRAAGVEPDFGGYAPWACYLAENSLPTTSVPKKDAVPSLFLLAENDELVDTAVERESFKTLCAQGHVLSYLECAGATHTKPLTYAFDQWLDFLEDRLDGKPVQDACVVKPAERCTSTP